MLARAAHAGQARDAAQKRKEAEVAGLLLAAPWLAHAHDELLAVLPFSDPSLDRLRRELLNLAASGSSLEKPPVLTHFERQGMADLLTRFGASPDTASQDPEQKQEAEARFLRAAADLREVAEWEPERARALERFAVEGSEESWREARRLMRSPGM